MARFETPADLVRMYPKRPRAPFNPQYFYLSEEDSRLLDARLGSQDENDRLIVRLILDKANASFAAHCREDR